MKTVLFVPGFRENLKTRDYKSTIKAIEEKGYGVKFVPINWQKTVISDWVKVEAKKYPLIGNRSQLTHKSIKNSRLITVTGSDHDVADKNYIAAIAEAI